MPRCTGPPPPVAPADEPPHDHRRRRRQHLHLGGSRVGDRRGSPHRQRRRRPPVRRSRWRSEEHTSELQSRPHLVCRLLLEKKKKFTKRTYLQLVDEAKETQTRTP